MEINRDPKFPFDVVADFDDLLFVVANDRAFRHAEIFKSGKMGKKIQAARYAADNRARI